MKRLCPKMISAAIVAVMVITGCTFAEEISYDNLIEIEITEDYQVEEPVSDESADEAPTEEAEVLEEIDSEMIDTEDFAPEMIDSEEIYLEETFTDVPVLEILLEQEPEEIDLNEYDFLFSDEIQESLLAGGDLNYKRDLYNGLNGEDVSALQQRLAELGYSVGAIDGQFGSVTEAAVRKFQKDHALTVDGIAGRLTIAAFNNINSGSAQTIVSTAAYSGRYLTIGMSGSDVITLQKRLAELGYNVGEIDGEFGSKTKAAVIAFQKEKGLYQDGEVGSITQSALFSNVPSSNSSAANPAVTASASDSLTITRSLKNGLSGTDVYMLQKCLETLGYNVGGADGIFGSYTESAVRAFQTDNKLYVDGIAGSITVSALNKWLIYLQKYTATSTTTNTITNATTNTSTATNNNTGNANVLKKGMTGSYVVMLQDRLKELGYFTGTSNGTFDTATESSLKLFQKYNGMATPNGVVDAWTYQQLIGTPVNLYGNTYSIKLTTSAGTSYLLRELSYEDEGNDVEALQQKLSDLGYLCAVPKGYFGNLTYDALVAFQKDHGMTNPTGVADQWTIEQLQKSTAKETVTVPEYTVSELTTSAIITDKNYDRNDYEIKYIIPHHMAGKLSGAGCANYFVNNGLENSANYCIGYDGDIAVSVPEDYGAWTSSWWFADEQGITIEVSDESRSTDYIPDKAIESLIYLCVDLIQRYPSLGGQMVYDPSDADIVIAAKKAKDGSMLNNINGNVLLHNWTSGGKTSCPGQDMIDKLPLVAQKVNELLANPNKKLDLSEFTKMTEEKKQKEEEERLKAEQEESEEE